jgi:hypothetical protein
MYYVYPYIFRKSALQSGVVWCGVVWCGVVWCGVVWCGVVWCAVVCCGAWWCGVVCCGAWCGVGVVLMLVGIALCGCFIPGFIPRTKRLFLKFSFFFHFAHWIKMCRKW